MAQMFWIDGSRQRGKWLTGRHDVRLGSGVDTKSVGTNTVIDREGKAEGWSWWMIKLIKSSATRERLTGSLKRTTWRWMEDMLVDK